MRNRWMLLDNLLKCWHVLEVMPTDPRVLINAFVPHFRKREVVII